MKRFTSLMLTLVLAVAAWAGPTDLPQITTDLENPIYYTIVNTRSSQPGGYMYFAGENIGIKDEQAAVVEAKHMFYFTGSHDALYVHNAATDLKLASIGRGNDAAGSWTAEGSVWAVGVSPKGGGLAFGPQGGLNGNDCWNECNYTTHADKPDFTTWSANDNGSIFLVTLAEDCGINVNDFYTIEAPLFENTQGVKKGLVVDENGSLGWNTIDLTNKNCYWVPTTVNGATVALKNLGTEMYLNGAEVSEEYVASTVKVLGLGQYNIVSNNITVHANNHGGGANASGNIVNWGGGINTASAWAFVEHNDPDGVSEITITYEFTYNNEVKYTQTTETLVGEEYPNITVAFPFGITATKPAGTIAADAGTTVTIALEENLPFVPAASFDAIENWYYVKLKGANYLYHEAGEDHIALNQTAVAADNKAAYSWAFVGNPFDGFQIVNMAAGEGYILSSSTNTADGNTGANTHPVMTATPVAEGNNELWVLTPSTYQENGFYLAQKGFASNRMNNRDGKLAYWNGGADNGSTFIVELRPSSVAELTTLAAQAEALLDQITIGEAVGQYSSNYEGYAAAYAEIAAYVEGGEMEETVAEEYVVTLSAIINSFSLNMPVAGKYYTFVQNGMYITSSVANDRIACSATKDASAIYYFDGSHLLAYKTGLYFGLNGTDWTFEAVGSDDISAIEFVAAANGAAGKFNISSAGKWLHLSTDFVNRCSNNTCAEHNWTIEEVEALPVSITAAGYATFFAPVAVTVADGVTAHTVKVDEYAQLSEALTVIPANTGVVLKGTEGTYNFAITTAAAFEGENDLLGTAAATNVTEAAYVLANKNGVGFYTAAMTDGAWLNNSHKAYLPKTEGMNAASYSLRFEGATTGIENVEVENAAVIYDLTGRQVNAVERGIYIINGKKVLVK